MEFLVIDVIGQLPQATISAIEAFAKKTSAFGPSDDWRAHVRNTFNLSNTIDIAILDLWYRNCDKAATEGWTHHPWHFAMNFIEQYFPTEATWTCGRMTRLRLRKSISPRGGT